jgi:hypothetical protein
MPRARARGMLCADGNMAVGSMNRLEGCLRIARIAVGVDGFLADDDWACSG